ncbi:FixH family protein [Aeromonas rivuli]|uniref:FixH family protein n=1 Tax=Aeromonas rivuli TaxID=648794 RepID=UPI001CCED5E7|nr:FixH family protein [Aeromonas rivuli]UBO75806.1 FixH family protein [Aeromonas rivuli]
MTQPWYRQFWPWFIIALPATVVVAGIATAIIASKDGVNLVAEDYYKQGKEINQDLSKFDRAEALNVHIALNLQESELTLKPVSGDLVPNQALRLSLFHPTLAGRDSDYLLTSDASGVYRLHLDHPLTGKWHIRVDAFDHEWRLQETVHFPLAAPVELDPKGR